MARPRIATSKLSKSGAWSRAQRAGTRGSRCARCGKTSGLVQHHPSGNPRKGSTSTLCRSCHLIKHPGIAKAGGKAS